MWYKILLAALVILTTSVVSTEGQTGGYRLARDASYFIVAPEKIHPNQVVQMSVSILNLYYPHINVRIIIRRFDEEVASTMEKFELPGTRMVQLKVPSYVEQGNYTIRIEGTANGGLSGYIFWNETEIIFDPKQVSVFIETNKPFYRQGQTVLFRILPVEANLMSRTGSVDVYIEDSTGTTVRRWLSMQTNAGGVLDMKFQLSDQPHYGWWKIKIKAFGHWYEKPFRVDEFWMPAVNVNVSMPLEVTEDEMGLAGVIMANFTIGQPVKGTVKLKLEVRRPPGAEDDEDTQSWPTIERQEQFFPGTLSFLFTMEEIRHLIGGSPKGRELYVEAHVKDWFRLEEQTGWAISVCHSSTVEVKLLGDSARTFKPNQTMYIYYAVANRDGTKIDRWRRQMTVSGNERSVTGNTIHFEHKFLVGEDGIARFTYKPREDGEFVRIQAYYDMEGSSSIEMTAYRAYSPTNSYIYITSSTETPHVDQYMVFTVTTTTYVERVNYLLTAGGNIITGSVLEMDSRQKTFSLALSRDMIPQAHIVVWYIYQDEVVADSMNFYVNGTRINSVDVRFNLGKDFTGDTVEISTRSDPSSYVGIHGMDYDLWAYGYRPFIREIDVVRELESFDSHANKSFQHVWKTKEEQEEMIHFPAPSYGVDANTTFAYAGLRVFTDANVTRIPHFCNETMGWHPCMDGSCYLWTQRCDEVRQCVDGQDEMGCVYEKESVYTPPTDRHKLVTRHYEELGEWLWRGHFIMPNGRLDLPTDVPVEPMPWVLSAFAISRDLGFGISHTLPRHQSTRPFYMRLEAPDNAVKGEQIGIRVVVFNYWEQNLEVIIMLHDSDQYRFVAVEEFGIVSSYNPRTIRGDIQVMVYLVKGSVMEIQMPILPVKVGCTTVGITAYSFIYGDYEEVTICTKFDGVTNYLHTPYFLDLVNTGSLVLPDLEVPVPERFIKPQERQHLYVPGSPLCNVGVVGDVVGPGFFEDHLTAENTLRKPFGSAEQAIYNFAYNLYNLKYLKQTNQLDRDTQQRTFTYLNTDLQRIMSYLNENGSFSMFRDYQEPTPSTWVSAFALRVLHDANDRDWELDFFIEVSLLNRIARWLCKQQNLVTGAFMETSPLYDRKMWSNYTLVNGLNVTSNFSLTAYVVTSLKLATALTGQAEICKTDSIQKAQQYLELHLMDIDDVYTLSIVTYALHIVGSSQSTTALNVLDSKKISTSYIYWADKEIPPNDIRMIDTIPYYQPRRWYDNEAYGVEATAYAMLTYLRRNKISDTVPIMKWLHTMRNTYAGQASTQDSIMALMALVEYAKLDTNRALYNVEVTVQATSMGNFSRAVRLDRTNWQIQQHVNVHPVFGSVRGRAQGTGMALMQLATSVHVEYPHQILPKAEGKYFDLELSYNHTGRNFSIYEIIPCARWARPDISPRSGLAVLEIHVPTGFEVTNDVLRAYAQSGDVPTLRRAEKIGRKIVYYFDYLEAENKTCVKTRLDRWFPVANMTIQHTLRVFDYYEPGMHNTTLHTTWTLFNLHLCRACGSFQCPFCPFYNTGTSNLQLNVTFSLLTALLASLLLHWTSHTVNLHTSTL